MEPKDHKVAVFGATQNIATYIYAVVAGPYEYHEYNNAAKNPIIPQMRIYGRKSVMSYINHEEIFGATVAGMKYYTDLFGRPIPLKKYDQVFAPESSSGGMENFGCVTYNEDSLYRGETITPGKRLVQMTTVLHELAHMWFGDLVTMKWWNDLWLNESFATYMSFLCLTEAPELEKFRDSAWLYFQSTKFSGITADQLSTTHPVCSEIQSTDQARSVFDGISYGKGAAFLKQVRNVLGSQNLKKALKIYFDKYAW